MISKCKSYIFFKYLYALQVSLFSYTIKIFKVLRFPTISETNNFIIILTWNLLEPFFDKELLSNTFSKEAYLINFWNTCFFSLDKIRKITWNVIIIETQVGASGNEFTTKIKTNFIFCLHQKILHSNYIQFMFLIVFSFYIIYL